LDVLYPFCHCAHTVRPQVLATHFFVGPKPRLRRPILYYSSVDVDEKQADSVIQLGSHNKFEIEPPG
jgi:hypothetical protein